MRGNTNPLHERILGRKLAESLPLDWNEASASSCQVRHQRCRIHIDHEQGVESVRTEHSINRALSQRCDDLGARHRNLGHGIVESERLEHPFGQKVSGHRADLTTAEIADRVRP